MHALLSDPPEMYQREQAKNDSGGDDVSFHKKTFSIVALRESTAIPATPTVGYKPAFEDLITER